MYTGNIMLNMHTMPTIHTYTVSYHTKHAHNVYDTHVYSASKGNIHTVPTTHMYIVPTIHSMHTN